MWRWIQNNLIRPLTDCQKNQNVNDRNYRPDSRKQNKKINIKFAKNWEKMMFHPNLLTKLPLNVVNNEYWKPTIDQLSLNEVALDWLNFKGILK